MQKLENIIHRLLEVNENDIVPLTEKGVCCGNKLFGAAILKKEDLSLVVANTNNETENPLWHGEIHTLKKLYELPKEERPEPKDCIFYATHEPCPLCLAAITWGGYDNFYYLFSYTDSRDAFNIPHDLKILKEVFKCDQGEYARENHYWKSHSISALVGECSEQKKVQFKNRIKDLQTKYDEMSETYQQSKCENAIPLK